MLGHRFLQPISSSCLLGPGIWIMRSRYPPVMSPVLLQRWPLALVKDDHFECETPRALEDLASCLSFPHGVGLSALFIMASSVCVVHQVPLRGPGKEVSPPTSPGPAEAVSLRLPLPLLGVLVIQSLYSLSVFFLLKIFIRCWDSDWGHKAVTKMALGPWPQFPPCVSQKLGLARS